MLRQVVRGIQKLPLGIWVLSVEQRQGRRTHGLRRERWWQRWWQR